jgi:hypothetical protein
MGLHEPKKVYTVLWFGCATSRGWCGCLSSVYLSGALISRGIHAECERSIKWKLTILIPLIGFTDCHKQNRSKNKNKNK